MTSGDASASGVSVDIDDVRSPTDSPDVVVDERRWAELARAVLTAEGVTGSLGLAFVDAAEIAELNAEHMGKSGPTDVLSFPIDGSDLPQAGVAGEPSDVPVMLGDVVLSPAVAAAQYATHAGTLDDELALLIVHGVLHVLGHDHAEPAETERMRRAEIEHLERFHWDGPAPASFRQEHAEP